MTHSPRPSCEGYRRETLVGILVVAEPGGPERIGVRDGNDYWRDALGFPL